MTEFDFGFKRNVQMFAYLPHNIGETIIGELAIKIKQLCCMIIGSQRFNKSCVKIVKHHFSICCFI